MALEKKRLRELARELDSYRGDAEEATKEIRDTLNDAKEQHGLHVKAFRLAWGLMRKDSTERSDFLRGFDQYRAALGLDDQADMLNDNQPEVAA